MTGLNRRGRVIINDFKHSSCLGKSVRQAQKLAKTPYSSGKELSLLLMIGVSKLFGGQYFLSEGKEESSTTSKVWEKRCMYELAYLPGI